jgi:hypothetical protein
MLLGQIHAFDPAVHAPADIEPYLLPVSADG